MRTENPIWHFVFCVNPVVQVSIMNTQALWEALSRLLRTVVAQSAGTCLGNQRVAGSSPARTSQYGVWTGRRRAASSPPGCYQGACEQGTEPLTAPDAISRGSPLALTSLHTLMHVWKKKIIFRSGINKVCLLLHSRDMISFSSTTRGQCSFAAASYWAMTVHYSTDLINLNIINRNYISLQCN